MTIFGRIAKISQPTLCLMIIVAVMSAANLQSSQALAQEAAFLDVAPSQAQQIVASIDEYTDFVDEDVGLITDVVNGEMNNDYLTKQTVLETRRTPEQYPVKKGDTLSSIANQYNITVATLLDANHFSPDRILKVNETITIPPETTNTSTEWLEELQQKQRQKEQERAKLRAQSARSSIASRGRSTVERSIDGYDGEPVSFTSPLVSNKGVTRRLSRFHTGVDARLIVGDPVLASAGGRVIEKTSGWGKGWGTSIVLDHGGGWTTRYAHLSGTNVSLNDVVEQGQVIGWGGSTGRSTGSHLHYERRRNGRSINPSEL